MGQPILHGYPDWGRQSAPSDVLIVATGSLVITQNTVIFEGFVGMSPYLQVRYIGDVANRTRVVFDWYADAAFTVFVSATQFVCTTIGRFDGSIAIAAPYVRITVFAQVFPTTINLTAIIGVVARRAMFADVALATLIVRTGTVVAAGATVTAESTFVHPGMAHWSVDTALATWTARLESGAIGGGFTSFASMRNTSLPGPRVVFLPMTWVRASFTNTTGAAGTFDTYLVGSGQGVG